MTGRTGQGWTTEKGKASTSGPQNSIPCYSLPRPVGNLWAIAQISTRFPMLNSTARPSKKRLSGKFPAKFPDPREFS